MNRPLVTVVIPVFNKEEFVFRSIDSVLKQTYENYELIIIDDGSTDKSKEKIIERINGNSRCKYFYQCNQGVSCARNKGIELAAGDFITFLDADDEYLDDFLMQMVLSIDDADAVYCGNYVVDHGVRKKTRISFREGELALNYLLNKSAAHTNSWLIRRQFLMNFNVRFIKGLGWGEDSSFFLEVILLASKVKYCDSFLTVYYSAIPDSLTLLGDQRKKISDDIFWLGHVKNVVMKSSLSSEDKTKCVTAIDGYRLPASVAYRIKNVCSKGVRQEFLGLYSDYKYILHEFSFVNGLRSLKLFFCLLWLKAKFFIFSF